jgi:hypothetical protein
VIDWSPVQERTWSLIERTHPGRFDADSCCFLWAAALAEGLRPHGGRMVAGGALLPGQGLDTWGIIVNPRDQTYFVTCDGAVDAEGTYTGHCWVEVKSGEWDWMRNAAEVTIYDAMTGYRGQPLGREPLLVYQPKPKLLASIRRHYRDEIAAVRRAARKDARFGRLCARLLTGTK